MTSDDENAFWGGYIQTNLGRTLVVDVYAAFRDRMLAEAVPPAIGTERAEETAKEMGYESFAHMLRETIYGRHPRRIVLETPPDKE